MQISLRTFRNIFAVTMALASTAFLTWALPVQATDDPLLVARGELREIYAKRGDLQQLFDESSWLPVGNQKTAGIRDLEDWAVQYGNKEHSELWWYGTMAGRSRVAALHGEPAPSSPQALEIIESAEVPHHVSGNGFDFSKITASAVYVVDAASHRALLAQNSDQPRADASSAKLMTAAVALKLGVNLDQKMTLTSTDETGGSRLEIPVGTKMTVREFMYGLLTGTANNAARVVARSTGLSVDDFTTKMNETARSWGLVSTSFVDPTGVVEGTLTTASEATALLIETLEQPEIRRLTTTGSKRLSCGITITNRNKLLTDPNNGLYVYGGNIGYLRASGWHMTIKLMDLTHKKPLYIAVSGSESLEKMLADVETLADWVWETHQWGAASQDSMTLQQARKVLRSVYDKRSDLQALFYSSNWEPVRSARTRGIADLEDWAVKYGYKEHHELWWYTTEAARRAMAEDQPQVVASSPRALTIRPTTLSPVNVTDAEFPMSSVTSQSVFVVDVPSRRPILANNADNFHVMASITKLMTALVTLERGPSMATSIQMMSEDEIGGARLRVPVGTALSLKNMMYAMLVGSANNSAHAIARATTGNVETFVDYMNAKADELGLANTTFTDPSGLDVGNISTAREIAALALEAWDIYDLRKMCSTAKHTLYAEGIEHTIKNTNELLTDANNGLIVLGGKTGYLNESLWNLAVKLMDERKKPILVVVLGSDSKANLFRDAHTVADWVWDNYRWQ